MKKQFTIFAKSVTRLFLVIIMLGTVSNIQAQNAKWTIMVYLDGDNDLEENAIIDFNEMESIGSSDSVNIVVQFDRVGGYDFSNGDWTNTRRYRIVQDADPSQITSSLVQNMSEQNMGDPEVLESFIVWAATNYPADRYALILWNHGGGWRKNLEEKLKPAGKKTLEPESIKPKPDGLYRDVCYDETSYDILYNDELGNALDSGGVHFPIIAFDACLMGMIETAYEIKDNATIMVASAEGVPLDGFNYSTILADLANHPGMPSDSFAIQMVNRYAEEYEYEASSFSALWLDTITLVKEMLDTLVSEILSEDASVWIDISKAWDNTNDYDDENNKDLYSYFNELANNTGNTSVLNDANALLEAFDSCIIHYYANGIHTGSKGLAIYFPHPDWADPDYFNDYYQVDFPNESLWPDFLQAFFENYITDEYENNNYFANASYLGEEYGYAGPAYLSDTIDMDIFYFVKDTSNYVFFEFKTEGLDMDYSAKLYTVIDTTITLLREDHVTPDTFEINYNGLPEGIYYVEVSANTAGSDAYEIFMYGTLGPDSFEMTKTYDDGIPDYVMNSDTSVNKGIVIEYPNKSFYESTYLKGLWYYVSDIDLVPGNGDEGTFGLILSVDYEEEPISITPEKTGWNYIDLEGYEFDAVWGSLGVAMLWDGYNTPGIGYDKGDLEETTGEIIIEDGEMVFIPYSKDSCKFFFIRPVLKTYSSSNNLCACDEITTLTEESGTFSDGSGDSDYGNNCECIWLIQPSSGNQIQLTFSNFSTEEFFDYVTIYDGDNTGTDILEDLSGFYEGDIIMTSSGGALLVEFSSDISITSSGWDASYTTEPSCHCDGLITRSNNSGIISDGSGSDDYGTNCDCWWLIEPSSPISLSLTFDNFETEEWNDVVTIYDGKNHTDPVIAELSGFIADTAIYSTSGSLLIHFESDESIGGPGWSASYTAITGTDQLLYSNVFEIIPNPNKGSFYLVMQGSNIPVVEVSIYNMVGKMVFKDMIHTTEPVEMSHLPDGLYLVKIVSNHKVFISKMIIEK